MNQLSKTFLLFALVLLMLTDTSLAALIEGKATVSAGAVPGVVVVAYPEGALAFTGQAPHRSQATAEDGLFALDLPAGRYYLFAEGRQLSAFYGRNPITVPEHGLTDVNLLLTPVNLAGPETETALESGIVGTVSLDGQPVPSAIVTVYPDLSSQLKGMGLGMAQPTDQQGYFELPLAAGTYYLVVRVRQGGQMAGPLKAGDLFGYLAGNPLVVAEGGLARVHIPLIEVPEKISRHSAKLFGETSISGQVLDQEGAPVAGLQVLLYTDSMMLNRPLYVSQKTGPDGRYQLSFPVGGHYYLCARNELGGTPAPGEFYGRYQGTPDHSIQIDTGKSLDNIEIVVDEVY